MTPPGDGGVAATVELQLGGGQEIVSVITRGPAERLQLAPGDRFAAVVEATEVIVAQG